MLRSIEFDNAITEMYNHLHLNLISNQHINNFRKRKCVNGNVYYYFFKKHGAIIK